MFRLKSANIFSDSSFSIQFIDTIWTVLNAVPRGSDAMPCPSNVQISVYALALAQYATSFKIAIKDS
jgi:hypothetical protein